MKINGYDINYDEAELKDKMENQTLDVRLISPDFEGYKNLSEGNKKALTHLVAAARMVNDVALVEWPSTPIRRTTKVKSSVMTSTAPTSERTHS